MDNNALPTGAQGQTPEVPKSVFITGASGFIGRALAERYRALGAEVRGMDLRADPANNVVAGDLVRPRAWAEHARGCELFINTAAIVSLAASWKDYRDVSVDGVRNCLDIAIAGGAKRFVHFSSIAALGWQDIDGDADEHSGVVIGDNYRYGVAKGASEHVVLAAHAAGEIDCTIIRPGDVYGPGSRAWLIEPLKMAKAGSLVLPSGGRGRWTPVYIDDLLDGAMLAAGLPQGAGQIFHISASESICVRDFFTHHWRWAGRSGNPPSLPLWLAVAVTNTLWSFNRLFRRANEVAPDVMYMFSRSGGISIDKARRLLGYQPKMSLQEGLRHSEAWLRETGQLG